MSVPRVGGCACGGVRYRLTSDPLFTHCCHCLNCQRQTRKRLRHQPADRSRPRGAAGGRPAADRRASRRRQQTADLPMPDLPGGGLHIFTRSKLSWITLPDSVPAFEVYYDMKALWPAASLERLEAIVRNPTPEAPTRAYKRSASIGLPQRCHRVPPKCTVAAENWLGAGGFGGTRRHACTQSRRLITRRSQVQILPRYLERPRKRGLFLCRAIRTPLCCSAYHPFVDGGSEPFDAPSKSSLKVLLRPLPPDSGETCLGPESAPKVLVRRAVTARPTSSQSAARTG
jgi:hypothetical protein